MLTDAELLRQFVREGSDAAFTEIVRRHVDLVYSAALRQMGGDRHRAQEVTQAVFVGLAQKAALLAGHPLLPGWLYTATRFAAAIERRKEHRRRAREEAAAADGFMAYEPAPPADWDRLRPVLDEAMNELSAADRAAILLRFFGNQAFAEIGRQLGWRENAARMRVERALDRLQASLERRGIRSTSAALGLILSGQAVTAAPVGAATAAAAAALATGATGTLTLVASLMATLKLPLSILAAVAVAGGAVAWHQERTAAQLRGDLAGLPAADSGLEAARQDHRRLALGAQEARDLRAATEGSEVDRQRLQARLDAQTAKGRRVPGPRVSANESADVFDISKLDQIPRAKKQVAPKYPLEMRRTGNSGQVLVDFVVDAQGMVRNAHAASSTQPEFEAAAIQAVSQWQFSAGTRGGRIVNTHMQVPIVFTLNPDDADWF